ncbi:hypothetical protein E0485_13390 [Paenibacillus albiflavus]|uniref:DUF4097 domain-containing protein n=1 Tax=Paenibacillus albiflavus TaxID=2545760 RepID=A0A4R4EEI4_9BACL|nr:DUF4097 family beta strand repeat-containing protein [Paenibacillus albiflavus]TCZ76581.1 hypothetical protein E0485_13390 [Paenibacillus albiflavus]
MKKILIALGIICMIVGGLGVVSTNFNFGQNSSGTFYEKEWTFSKNELKNFKIDSSLAIDVQMVSSSDDHGSVRISGSAPEEVIAQIEAAKISNGTLDLNLHDKSKYFAFFNFSGSDKQKIVITMSEQEILDSLTTKTSSGSMNLSNLRAHRADIRSTAGSVSVANLYADQANVASTSGSVSILELLADQLDVSSTAGSVRVDQVSAERISLGATSGSIKGAKLKGNIQVSASAGSVRLEQVTSDNIKVETTSGSIHLTDLITKSAEIESSAGSVSLTIPAGFGGMYDLRSSSGSISAPDSKKQTDEVIKVRTTSGSISIKEK